MKNPVKRYMEKYKSTTTSLKNNLKIKWKIPCFKQYEHLDNAIKTLFQLCATFHDTMYIYYFSLLQHQKLPCMLFSTVEGYCRNAV